MRRPWVEGPQGRELLATRGLDLPALLLDICVVALDPGGGLLLEPPALRDDSRDGCEDAQAHGGDAHEHHQHPARGVTRHLAADKHRDGEHAHRGQQLDNDALAPLLLLGRRVEDGDGALGTDLPHSGVAVEQRIGGGRRQVDAAENRHVVARDSGRAREVEPPVPIVEVAVSHREERHVAQARRPLEPLAVEHDPVAGSALREPVRPRAAFLDHEKGVARIGAGKHEVAVRQAADGKGRDAAEVDAAVVGAAATLEVDGEADRDEGCRRVGVLERERVRVAHLRIGEALHPVGAEVHLLGTRDRPGGVIETGELELERREEQVRAVTNLVARERAHADRLDAGRQLDLTEGVVPRDGKKEIVSHNYSVTLMIEPSTMPYSPRVLLPWSSATGFSALR